MAVKEAPRNFHGMLRNFARSVVAISAVLASASACAMSAPNRPVPAGCRVVNPGKLPPQAGGEGAICSAVERAVAARAPGLRYSAEVTVVSKFMLKAALVAHGRALPEQNFAVMDKNLDAASIERFAQSVAEALVDGAKK